MRAIGLKRAVQALVAAAAVLSSACSAAAPNDTGASAAPYLVAMQWGVPKCSRYGSGERLVLKSGERRDLKPALAYFLRTHDLSECWFVDIFTDEKALDEFKFETSPAAESASDEAKQRLTSDYAQLNNDPKTHERWYGLPMRLPNGRWVDKITEIR